MNMFKSFLASLPPNRHLMVSELEIPDDITATPYVWTEPEPLSTTSDSLLSGSFEDDYVEPGSTDSSASLSGCLTDSEIDYYRYRQLKNRSYSDPWANLRAAMDAFPPDYLASLQSFQSLSTDVTDVPKKSTYVPSSHRNEELELKVERFFEECRVFTPEDPGLLALEKALLDVDMTTIDSDSDSSILPPP